MFEFGEWDIFADVDGRFRVQKYDDDEGMRIMELETEVMSVKMW